ncbi:MAG: HEAT repeat domain-containing protein [Limisphaerales bacterium]
MKKPFVFALLMLGTLIGAMLWALQTKEAKPVVGTGTVIQPAINHVSAIDPTLVPFKGMTLLEWLATMNMDEGNIPEGMREAVSFYGSNAVPVLLEMAGHSDSSVKKQLLDLQRRHTFVRLGLVRAYENRWRATSVMQFVRPHARLAVPELIRLLTHEDPEVRRDAAGGLLMLEEGAEAAVPALVRRLKDGDAQVRAKAAAALGRIGKHPQLAVPALIAAISDPNEKVRANASGHLAAFGADAKPAVPHLLKALTDVAPAVRVRARNALNVIAPDAEEAPPSK